MSSIGYENCVCVFVKLKIYEVLIKVLKMVEEIMLVFKVYRFLIFFYGLEFMIFLGS